MIKLGNTDYKVCYLDTNIIRATLEMSQGIHQNTLLKLQGKNVFAFSVLTLVEISHKPNLIDRFNNFIDAIPILILKPSNQILDIEKEKFNQKITIEYLILLTSNPLQPETMNEIKQFLKTDKFQEICHILKQNQTEAYNRINKEIEIEKDINLTVDEFVIKRLKSNVGNKYVISMNDSNFLSQKIINLLLYYTYKYRKKKAERSDPFDFLISSAVPYVDVFITENSQAKTLKIIKENHDIINSVSILRMKDLRGTKNMAPNSE